MQELIQISTLNGVEVVDSRIIAEELGIQHDNLMETIRKHQPNIEDHFGMVTFETLPLEVSPFQTDKGGRPKRVAYLTEDQAIFVGTLSRNSQTVVEFKARLVKSFQTVRRLSQQPSVATPAVALPSVKELAMMVIKAEEEKELLLAENAKLLPKAEYTDLVLQSDKLYTTTEIAKELGMSARRLNETLCFQKIQYKHRHHYVLSAKYSNKEYTQTTTTPYIDKDGVVHTRMQMEWTEYGRAFIQHLFNDKLSFSKAAQQNKRKEVGNVNA